jgi:hypothetical protein
MDEEEREHEVSSDMKMLQDTADILRSQFDTVQIFATRHNRQTGETVSVVEGSGDYYARVGVTRIWLLRQEHYNATHESPEEE